MLGNKINDLCNHSNCMVAWKQHAKSMQSVAGERQVPGNHIYMVKDSNNATLKANKTINIKADGNESNTN